MASCTFLEGGRGGLLSNLDVNEEYDPEHDKWIVKAPMPSRRGGIVGASFGDSIFVFGGETPFGTFDNNEQYITSLDRWIVNDRMPSARHGLAAAESGGSIYVIGGGLKPRLSVSGKNKAFTPLDLNDTDLEELVVTLPTDKIIETVVGRELLFEQSVEDGDFTHILQVIDSNGFTVHISFKESEADKISQMWMPESSGRYVVQSFVWRDMEHPKILAQWCYNRHIMTSTELFISKNVQ
jgi:hypothetical protein